MSGLEFDTELLRERNAVRMCVPVELAGQVGTERLVPAVVTINGVAIPTTLHKLAGSYMMAVNKAVQAQVGAGAGDRVRVCIHRDEAPRPVELPDDLAAALADSGTRPAFDALTPFRQTELVKSVTSARRPETRADRISRVIRDLPAG